MKLLELEPALPHIPETLVIVLIALLAISGLGMFILRLRDHSRTGPQLNEPGGFLSYLGLLGFGILVFVPAFGAWWILPIFV
jgi:hypothetical protein